MNQVKPAESKSQQAPQSQGQVRPERPERSERPERQERPGKTGKTCENRKPGRCKRPRSFRWSQTASGSTKTRRSGQMRSDGARQTPRGQMPPQATRTEDLRQARAIRQTAEDSRGKA